MPTRQLLLDKAQWISGWMSMKELSFLAEISNELKNNSIIYEIGSYCGRSTRSIADNSLDSCKIYCVDPWDFRIPTYDANGNIAEMMIIDTITYQQFCLNLGDHIKSSKVISVRMKWEDFILTKEADFIFIDGNHTYEAVKHDILKAIKYAKSGGIIAGHDYKIFDGVDMAVDECFQKSKFWVRETIWWTKKS